MTAVPTHSSKRSVASATKASATITANSGIASRLQSELAGGCVGLGGAAGAAGATAGERDLLLLTHG